MPASETAKKRLSGGIIIAIIVTLLASALIAVLTLSKNDATTSTTNNANASTSSDNYAVISPFAKTASVKNAKTVDVYEDFQCPGCGQMERKSGAELRKLAANGKIKLNYHTMNFLDNMLKNNSSTRAGNAAMCANDEGKFMDLHDMIFANQPKQEGAGYTDQQLRDWGQKLGLGEKYVSCVTGLNHRSQVIRSNDVATKYGVIRTPTVLIDNMILSEIDKTALQSGDNTWSNILDIK